MNRTLLLKAVQFAAQAITGKSSLPILENLYLHGNGERLSVTGYNGDLYARMEVESDLIIDCCAPAKRLKTLLENFTGDDVELTEDGITGPQTGKFKTLPGADYPVIVPVEGKRFKLPGIAISKVLPAASIEAARYVLNSVLLAKDHALTGDGRRMHRMKIKGPDAPIILPSAAAALLADKEGEMRTKDGRFAATGKDWEIGGKLIEGEFPTVPNPPDKEGCPVTADFIAAIKRAEACMGQSAFSYVDVTSEEVSTVDFNEPCEIEIACPFRATPRFLLDAIKSAGDLPNLYVTPRGPIVITNGDFKAAVMPMERKEIP